MGRIPRVLKEKKLNTSMSDSDNSNSKQSDDSDPLALLPSPSQSQQSSSSLNLKEIIMMNETNSSIMSLQKSNNTESTATHSTYFLRMSFENSNQLFFNSLREKTFHTYTNYSSRYDKMFEKAIFYSSRCLTSVDGLSENQVKLSDIWNAVMCTISNDLNYFIKFLLSFPGFSYLKRNDFNNLLKENLLTIYVLTTLRLYINDELYYTLDGDLQYSKKRMRMAYGDQVVEKVFSAAKKLYEIKITDCELALFIPHIITLTGLDLHI